jgi:hypothetical protein
MTLTTFFFPRRRAAITQVTRFAAVAGLLFTLACGSSNSERPYADGAAPNATGGSSGTPYGGAPGSGGDNGIDQGSAGGMIGTDANPATTGGSPGTSATGGAVASDAATDAGTLPPHDSDSAAACTPIVIPACDAPAPPAPPKRKWNRLASAITAAGSPRHRGHDLFLVPDAPQWLLAHFAYGLFDAALVGEEVDVFLLRDCGATWEPLGVAITTGDGEHATIEGVADPGGRVYFPVPADKRLGPGRHRARFVVAGDGSATEAFIEVRPAGTPIAVVDVDGTLTTSEAAEFGALLTGQLPAAQPDAARALALLPASGQRVLYLTARPEWLTERTREFLASAGFPAGIVETTTGGSGALGADATKFKTEALTRIAGKGFPLDLAIGNTESDAEAYAAANIQPAQRRIFFQFTDSKNGGRRIESYADLLADFGHLCP